MQENAPNYGDWFHLTATITFTPDDIRPDNHYNVLVFDNVDAGTNIHIDDISFSLPDKTSYDDPDDHCSNLVKNGDAEGNGFHPHPVRIVDSNNRLLVLEEESNGGNKFYRLVGRNDRYDSPVFDLNSACLFKNHVYRVSARVRIHSPTPVGYELDVLKCLRDDCGWYKRYKLGECAPQSIEDGDNGWVLCQGEVTVPASMLDGAVGHNLRIMLKDQTYSEEISNVDLDDVSLTFVSGEIEGINVEGDVVGCWGPGSEIMVTSHTLAWNGHQTAIVSSVEANRDGTTRLTLADSILPATTLTEPDMLSRNMASEVALLSRNVLIEGAKDDPSYPDHGGYMAFYHTPDVDQVLEGVEFRNMGQLGVHDRFVSF